VKSSFGSREKMNTYTEAPYRYVTTLNELKTVAAEFENASAVGVDLEADSMYHYREKVCLIQMATDRLNVVIDPLVIDDLSSLEPVFSRSDIRKVFHGADYDVRSLYRDFNIEINNLFDTQLASRFLGIEETGLEAVIKQRFGKTLDKRFQKKNWSLRPLPDEMIQYAAEDVIYLIDLAQMLEAELKEKERLEWVMEECRLLTGVRPAEQNGEPLYIKCKGAGKLDRRSLAVLEGLLQYRQTVAERKDRPLFKIISNGALLNIARCMPVTMDQLKTLCGVSAKQVQMYGKPLLRITARALEIPVNQLPVYPHKKAPVPEPGVAARMKVLKSYRNRLADQLCMDPPLLCNKSLLAAIAVKKPANVRELASIDEIKHWQVDVFGNKMVSLLGDMGTKGSTAGTRKASGGIGGPTTGLRAGYV